MSEKNNPRSSLSNMPLTVAIPLIAFNIFLLSTSGMPLILAITLAVSIILIPKGIGYYNSKLFDDEREEKEHFSTFKRNMDVLLILIGILSITTAVINNYLENNYYLYFSIISIIIFQCLAYTRIVTANFSNMVSLIIAGVEQKNLKKDLLYSILPISYSVVISGVAIVEYYNGGFNFYAYIGSILSSYLLLGIGMIKFIKMDERMSQIFGKSSYSTFSISRYIIAVSLIIYLFIYILKIEIWNIAIISTLLMYLIVIQVVYKISTTTNGVYKDV